MLVEVEKEEVVVEQTEVMDKEKKVDNEVVVEEDKEAVEVEEM